MTHDGPIDSATCTYTCEQGIKRYGSQFQRELILKHDEAVLINVHGHCHDGHFHSKLKKEAKSIIVNPGSLKFGQYGEATLVKIGNTWKVASLTKHYLN